jgi:hypothetical protein
MTDVAYTLAVGLALVFAWAGVAKLLAPRPTARSFAALGVPPGLARVVPYVELALAAGMVLAPITAIGALVLLGAFTIVLVGADDGVRCACFGSASSEPVSWVQVLRNGFLAAAAAVASGSTPRVPSLAAVLTTAGIAAIGLLVLALADLKRKTGAVLALDLP